MRLPSASALPCAPTTAWDAMEGEEFIIVMPGLSQEDSLARIRVHQAVGNGPVIYNNVEVPVTCSRGVAWLEQSHDLESLVQAFDRVLYSAKANGRNRVETADPPAPIVSGA
jgi:diguanylate cyclase (GGDEF)-like protein